MFACDTRIQPINYVRDFYIKNKQGNDNVLGHRDDQLISVGFILRIDNENSEYSI